MKRLALMAACGAASLLAFGLAGATEADDKPIEASAPYPKPNGADACYVLCDRPVPGAPSLPEDRFTVYHDDEAGVTCWVYHHAGAAGLSCLPDHLVMEGRP